MLKKIIAFVLLIALMVNIMGYFVIFQCNQFLLRHEMADQIRAGTYIGKLENIKISKESPDRNLKFSDENDEFFYHGFLYDMVAVDSTKDTITYTCIRDKNEQSLVDKFTLFLHQHSGFQETKKAKPILALIQHLFLQALIQKTLSPKPCTEKEFLFPVMVCHIIPVFLPDFSPPPEAS